MNNNMANVIAKYRKQNGMTQKQLAEKLGVTDKAVSKWERGVSHSKGYEETNPCLSCLQ